jgi:FixJ family two-component response regulator
MSQVIFVVDDDASVRTAVRRLLMSLRYPVRLFASAEEFLSQTDIAARGCLVLDVRLPGMNGLQLQQQLCDQDWKLPVIFITAHDDDESRDLAIRRGAVAYLRKPFNREGLLGGVREALTRSGK